jgi:hypothetical protein
MPATRLARLNARRAARARRVRRATAAIGLTLSTTILLVAMLGIPGALAREAEETLVPDPGPVSEPASIAGTAPVDPLTGPLTEPEPTAATGEAEKALEADQPSAPVPTPVTVPEPDGERTASGRVTGRAPAPAWTSASAGRSTRPGSCRSPP